MSHRQILLVALSITAIAVAVGGPVTYRLLSGQTSSNYFCCMVPGSCTTIIGNSCPEGITGASTAQACHDACQQVPVYCCSMTSHCVEKPYSACLAEAGIHFTTANQCIVSCQFFSQPSSSSSSYAPPPFCGNGIKESGEACDDGNRSNNDNCLNNCTKAACGDNNLHYGDDGAANTHDNNEEECDPGQGNFIDASVADKEEKDLSEEDLDELKTKNCLPDCTYTACSDLAAYTRAQSCEDQLDGKPDNDCDEFVTPRPQGAGVDALVDELRGDWGCRLTLRKNGKFIETVYAPGRNSEECPCKVTQQEDPDEESSSSDGGVGYRQSPGSVLLAQAGGRKWYPTKAACNNECGAKHECAAAECVSHNPDGTCSQFCIRRNGNGTCAEQSPNGWYCRECADINEACGGESPICCGSYTYDDKDGAKDQTEIHCRSENNQDATCQTPGDGVSVGPKTSPECSNNIPGPAGGGSSTNGSGGSNGSNGSGGSNGSTESNGSTGSQGSSSNHRSNGSNGSMGSQSSSVGSLLSVTGSSTSGNPSSAHSRTSVSGGSQRSGGSTSGISVIGSSAAATLVASTPSSTALIPGACGNGLRDPWETCDDGNTLSGDGCTASCVYEPLVAASNLCGNGILEGSETCDDGNTLSGDGCSAFCSFEEYPTSMYLQQQSAPSYLAAASICGDGQKGDREECDDDNAVSGDGCSGTCFLESGSCGDGVLQRALGERCEPSIIDTYVPYPCNPATCHFILPDCGNGRLDPQEECDGTAFCRSDCTKPRCGDQAVDTGETCDDGNVISGDGCSSLCTLEHRAPISIPFPHQPSPAQVLPFATIVHGQQPMQPPAPQTGPASIAVMTAGAALGVAWLRRKRKPQVA